jgi:hypothetical protein
MGLRFVAEGDHFIQRREGAAYAVFFSGACLTWLGSSYYHWAPRDATLAWDRLPMTLTVMSLLSAMIAERISIPVGGRLLWPLVAAGVASVWWWRWAGNLWPYVAAQYFSIFLIAWLLVFFPSAYTRTGGLGIAAGLYVMAKVAEALDAPIYALTGWISGHTLKHLIAAVAVYWVLRTLRKRAPRIATPHIAASARPRLPLF